MAFSCKFYFKSVKNCFTTFFMNSDYNPSFICLRVKNQIGNALTDGMQSTIMDEHTVKFSIENIQNPSSLHGPNKMFHQIFSLKNTHFSY